MTDIVEQLRDPKLDHDCLHRLSAADIIESLRQQLAECQAREVVLRDALNDVLANATVHFPEHMIWPIESALAMQSDSTELDTMLKQAKREALLDAATQMESYCGPTVYYELHRMANKLEETK